MTSSELKQAAKFALKDNFITKMLLFIVPLFTFYSDKSFHRVAISDLTTSVE